MSYLIYAGVCSAMGTLAFIGFGKPGDVWFAASLIILACGRRDK